jgi:hypothetical protein
MSEYGTNKQTYTIAEVEHSINYWCSRDTTGKTDVLRGPARVLADVYGLMIYNRYDSIDVASLTTEQADALDVALAALYPNS